MIIALGIKWEKSMKAIRDNSFNTSSPVQIVCSVWKTGNLKTEFNSKHFQLY